MEKIRIEQHSSVGLLGSPAGSSPSATCKLAFWQGVLAIFIWPYYLGAAWLDDRSGLNASAGSPTARAGR